MADAISIRTALYAEHVALGANIVDFHGFELPIWYSSIGEEHLACRSGAGIFDVSHMGSFRFVGAGVKEWLESIATQRVSAIATGRCGYTHFLSQEGFIIDDMIFAIVSDQEILGVPNASMIPVMWQWFNQHLVDGIIVEDLSSQMSIIALQGPDAKRICCEVLGKDNHVGRFAWSTISDNSLKIDGWIQGTGYTGEAGYEIFIANTQAPSLWRALVSAGACPVGLGARDTLRLEKGYLLSGQDFACPSLEDDDFLHRDSWETNVPFGLDLNHEFIGKSRVESHLSSDARWWGLKQLERGPLPRPGKYVQSLDGQVIGRLTSGAPSPSLANVGIGMAYLSGVCVGDEVFIVASARKKVKAVILQPPFV
jgi:aminomethyltransferase